MVAMQTIDDFYSDFEEEIQNGNLVADHGEYSLTDLSYITYII